MDESSSLPTPQLNPERERAIQKLSVHFAEDRIDAEQLEKRVDRVYAATSLAEIEATLAGLPDLHDPATAVGSVEPGTPVRQSQILFAMMGGTERHGPWTPARQINALALMGGLDIDFREARFAPGVTELNVMALMGGVDILVPPGLRVECEGFGFMGGFDGHEQAGSSENGPILRIRGFAMMGGIDVTERLPGETARDRRKRRKLERQDRKRLRSG